MVVGEMSSIRVNRRAGAVAIRAYLAKSLGKRRLNGGAGRSVRLGTLFRTHLQTANSSDRATPAGWLMQCPGIGKFASEAVILFPEVCTDISDLTEGRLLTEPSRGLHTICSTFHQIGIRSFFCSLQVTDAVEPLTYSWQALRLGTPVQEAWQPLEDALAPHLSRRQRPYNWLRYHTDTARIADEFVIEEFLKEHLRVSALTPYVGEISDVDGIFWGNEKTYPLEIKEKTAAFDPKMGEYFGIDVGPFVKLAYYAAKRGNLHSLFVVREIEDIESRRLRHWWFIPFDRLAQYASWNQLGGGRNMRGGSSTVVRIPKDRFIAMDRAALDGL